MRWCDIRIQICHDYEAAQARLKMSDLECLVTSRWLKLYMRVFITLHSWVAILTPFSLGESPILELSHGCPKDSQILATPCGSLIFFKVLPVFQ